MESPLPTPLIFIATKTEEEHDKLLEQMLERLEKAITKIRYENCECYAQELLYLGHCINSTVIHPVKEKVQATKEAL